jgi:hypothetical protein
VAAVAKIEEKVNEEEEEELEEADWLASTSTVTVLALVLLRLPPQMRRTAANRRLKENFDQSDDDDEADDEDDCVSLAVEFVVTLTEATRVYCRVSSGATDPSLCSHVPLGGSVCSSTNPWRRWLIPHTLSDCRALQKPSWQGVLSAIDVRGCRCWYLLACAWVCACRLDPAADEADDEVVVVAAVGSSNSVCHCASSSCRVTLGPKRS